MEGRPKYRQRPWKRGFVTMESVIDGLKFTWAMCCWTTKVYGDSLTVTFMWVKWQYEIEIDEIQKKGLFTP